MICTNAFVFIHLHKAAGQSINAALQHCMPSAKPIGYHYPAALIPQEYSDLPIVGIIRNPWDWYVSWYAFNNIGGVKNPLFNIVSNGKQADFKTTISNLLCLPNASALSKQMRRTHASLLPAEFGHDQGAGFTAQCVRDMQSDIQGYYSVLIRRMFGERVGKICFLHFDQVISELHQTLTRFDVPEAPAIRQCLNAQPIKNASARSHYCHYFDDELRELVADKEQAIIDRFGFTFEHETANAPIMMIDNPLRHSKVGGSQENFRHLGFVADLQPLKATVMGLAEDVWSLSDRQTVFDIHKETQSINLAFEDMSHTAPTYGPLYAHLASALAPILAALERVFGPDGTFVRILLARLDAQAEIKPHVDKGYSLMNCNRVHIPLKTHERVRFHVGGDVLHMREGEIWEINNGNVHAVENPSTEARIHLIIDWAPTHTLLKEKKPYRKDLPLFYQPQSRITGA
mgnify:CR=1 FL=1